jgi:hypothetical protein
MPTLDEAIAHFEAIADLARANGDATPDHADYARYLKQLKWYEAAIASGELVWKKKRKPKESING